MLDIAITRALAVWPALPTPWSDVTPTTTMPLIRVMATIIRGTVRTLLIAIAAGAGLWLVAERLRQVARRRLSAMAPLKPAQLPADLRAAIERVFVGIRVDAVRELV